MERVEVHNLDVGQSGAAFIVAIADDRAILILIDGGKNEASDKVYILEESFRRSYRHCCHKSLGCGSLWWN